MKILDTLTLSCGGSVTVHIEDISTIKDSDFMDVRNWLALMEHRYSDKERANGGGHL